MPMRSIRTTWTNNVYTGWYLILIAQSIVLIQVENSGLIISCVIFTLQAAKQAKLDKFETPAKIKLLPEPWTPESGLVTAALKLKREVIRKAFADDLANLYA